MRLWGAAAIMGSMIVYLTAWTATAAYFAALIAPPRTLWRAGLWTFGWACYLLHVAAAFQLVHHWSHAAAVEHTSRRALEVTGEPAPSGIYYNHVFTLVWTLDVAWLWLAPGSYARRPWWLTGLLHGYLLFIVVNATVVFGQGFIRWFGGAALALWAVVALRRIALARRSG